MSLRLFCQNWNTPIGHVEFGRVCDLKYENRDLYKGCGFLLFVIACIWFGLVLLCTLVCDVIKIGF